MYCAPLGVVRARQPDRLVEEAPALSRLTHWDGRCQTACLAVTSTVAALVRGEEADAAVLGGLAIVSDREGGEELEFLVGEAGRSRQLDGPDQGFALFTAGIALQVAGEELGFEDGLRYVVGLGGDTDTNAAVSGALLGAFHGVGAIPPDWLDRLAERDEIELEASALAALIVADRRNARFPGPH
jgi:ADP-ribosylglycohydrolase